MNLLSNAISVLCYGDSNTYGQKPTRDGRFDANKRWTGVLQAELGDGYYIIEEGLGGRTTNLDHPNPNKPSRNGLQYFNACLDSHSPLDVVIIMLGTNDFKTTYNRSVEEIAAAIGEYCASINNSYAAHSTKPKVLLVSPPYMDDTTPLFYESMPTSGIYDQTSIEKSHQLAAQIDELARENNVQFLDAALFTEPGEDGCHITESSHHRLGQEIAQLLRADV